MTDQERRRQKRAKEEKVEADRKKQEHDCTLTLVLGALVGAAS